MRATTIIVTSAAVVTTTLTGCSSSSTSGVGASTSSLTTQAIAEAPNSTESDMPGDGEVEAQPSYPAEASPSSVAVGSAFAYPGSDGSVQDLVVTSMKCGAPSVPRGADGSETYYAATGKSFCVVKGISKNTGNTPVDSVPYMETVTGSDQKVYAQSDGDKDAGDAAAENGYNGTGFAISDGFNPGDSVNWQSIYQMPDGVRPTAIQLGGDEDPNGDPPVLLQLPNE